MRYAPLLFGVPTPVGDVIGRKELRRHANAVQTASAPRCATHVLEPFQDEMAGLMPAPRKKGPAGRRARGPAPGVSCLKTKHIMDVLELILYCGSTAEHVKLMSQYERECASLVQRFGSLDQRCAAKWHRINRDSIGLWGASYPQAGEARQGGP